MPEIHTLQAALIRVIFILLLIAGYFAIRALIRLPPGLLARYVRLILKIFLGLIIAYLAATGRLNWLFALISVLMVSALRLLPGLLRYAPYLQQIWSVFRRYKQNPGYQQKTDTTNSGNMSVAEAYAVLGLKAGASKSDIIAAHRKLMQKNHPDHGGSTYIAAKINLAKKILLKDD